MSDPFFDRFRTAIARLPAGLIRAVPPAAPSSIAEAEAALGRRLPERYAAFLRSFDGADLFHETVTLAGVGARAIRRLVDLAQPYAGELVFAEALSGDLYTLDPAGRVLRRDPGADERALAGTTFDAWLAATIAREQILFGPDGEYAPDVFDPAGQDVLPRIALRQAERALKLDPGAADAEHARGLALLRLGKREAALAALEAATALDPDNAWTWFDVGRTALALGRGRTAREAFVEAAAREQGAAGARLLAWAARAALIAGDAAGAATLRDEALARDPGLGEGLRRAAEEQTASTGREGVGEPDDETAGEEALALWQAIVPGATLPARVRLRVIETDAEARRPDVLPPPPPRPPRPRPGTRPRSGGSRRGSPR